MVVKGAVECVAICRQGGDGLGGDAGLSVCRWLERGGEVYLEFGVVKEETRKGMLGGWTFLLDVLEHRWVGEKLREGEVRNLRM